MKHVWIVAEEMIDYKWTTYHFIHDVYDSRELADKAIAERVKLYGGHEDDYVVIMMPLIQEGEK